MDNLGINWHQRYITFTKVFQQFERFILVEELNEMEKQGLIKGFEYTYELAWKTIQALLKENGYTNIIGPRPVIEQAIKDGLISDGKGWFRMLDSITLTSQTHEERTAKELIVSIRTEYFALLKSLINRLERERVGK